MRAKRSLGQNFLQDDGVIEKIVGSLDLNSNDTVIEIGPGRGALTEKLIGQAGRVVAVEFDRDMVAILRGKFGDALNIVQGDVLSVDLGSLAGDRAKVVGNLPYNISTPILQRLMEHRTRFLRLVLMFQREVVDRLTAPPGSSERGYLTVLTEAAFNVERLFDVPPTAFRPAPKVWSAVARFTPTQDAIASDPVFHRLVGRAFAQKRKTILNNLKLEYANALELLDAAGIDGARRAETLTLDEWTALAKKAGA